MKQLLPSSLKHFSNTKDRNTIPDSSGLYLIADCPLVNIDPSKWMCAILKKGKATALKSTINNIVNAGGLAKNHDDLTYFYYSKDMTGLPPNQYQDFLSGIDQDHT